MKKMLFASLAFLFTVAGVQALPLRYISLEPIEAIRSRWGLVDILALIDKEQFKNVTSYIGKIIGEKYSFSYIVRAIGFWEDDVHQNQGLKKVRILVASDMSIREGDKIYAGGKDSWYEVTNVSPCCDNDYLEIILTQRTV